jgi:hypothetical protein
MTLLKPFSLLRGRNRAVFARILESSSMRGATRR